MSARLADNAWVLSLAVVAALLLLWQALGLAGMLPAYVLAPTGIVCRCRRTPRLRRSSPRRRPQPAPPDQRLPSRRHDGVVLGLVAGVFRPAEDVLDTTVSLTYPLPKIALFPVVVVWLGFSDTARILIIAVSCFYPSFVNAFAGTRGIDRQLLWVARNVGASRLRRFRQVIFRAAMPTIATGVRISLALSFVLTFATESIGASRDGLGYIIEEGFNNLFYDWMYAGIVMFGILGFLADRLWLAAAGRLLRGQTQAVGRV